MFNRQIYLSLLSSVFLFGSTQTIIAMGIESDDEEEKLHFLAHPSCSSSNDKSTGKNKVVITAQDEENFKLITTVQNPFLETNEQLDKIQSLLSAPIQAELSLAQYLKLKNPEEEEGANSSIFVGLLKNQIKVVIKRNKFLNSSQEEIQTSYDLDEAIPELVAPQIARTYFDVPTLPPTVYIQKENGHFEVRQYFIEGESAGGESGEEDSEKRLKVSREMYLHPELFNRPPNFIDLNAIGNYFFDDLGYDSDEEIRTQQQEPLVALLKDLCTEWIGIYKVSPVDIGHLRLFDLFIAAADRNNTQHLFIPCTNTQDTKQKWAYFGIDYAETYYDSRRGIVDMSDSGSGSDSEEEYEKEEPQLTAPLSAINKLKVLHQTFRSYFKEAEELAPEIYNDTYFKAFKEHQEKLLNRLVGIDS